MENIEDKKELGQTVDKAKKFGVLDWIILIVCLFMLPGSILLFITDILRSGSSVIADIVWFFLSIWGLKVKLKKFKTIKTPKSYKTIHIIAWVVAAIVLVPALLSIFSALSHMKSNTNIEQGKQTGIEFKKLSSVEAVEKISELNESEQITAYKEHSALMKEVQQIWNKNMEGKDSQLALNKTLPTLISESWTDESARDALSWTTAKSLIILDRDPSWWCKSGDCTPKSDAEIRIILREDKILTEKVIDGIFRELEIDNS